MSRVLSAILVASLMLAAEAAFADDWNLVKNVRRLESVAPDYKDDKPIDKKFLEVLDLTEKTRKEGEIFDEAKKIAKMPALSQTKYMDSFAYFMLARAAQAKLGAEANYWLGQLKAFEKSPHMLAAGLIHIGMLQKDSAEVFRETQQLVDWVRAQKPEMRVRPPEYTGNMLMGYKPRADFSDGDYPKIYSLAHYKASVDPLAGFHDEGAYAALLTRIKDSHEDTLSELADVYRKSGKREDASNTLLQLANLKVNAKDYQAAKPLLDDAVRLNPKNEDAKKARDRIKLELTYQSLQPQEVPAAASAPQENSAAH